MLALTQFPVVAESLKTSLLGVYLITFPGKLSPFFLIELENPSIFTDGQMDSLLIDLKLKTSLFTNKYNDVCIFNSAKELFRRFISSSLLHSEMSSEFQGPACSPVRVFGMLRWSPLGELTDDVSVQEVLYM